MARRQTPVVRPPRPEVLAFLQDIKEHPEDDTPRLILADWLEDHDDEPRAEFVRLQVELARPGPHPQRSALRERERQLLARHASGWLGPLDCATSEWEFERGLIQLTVVVDRPAGRRRLGGRSDPSEGPGGLLSLVGTEAFAWVDRLTFHGLRPEDVGLLVQATTPAGGRSGGSEPSLLGGLIGLHLPHGNAIAGEPLAALVAAPALRHLVTLDLCWAAAGDAGASAVAAASSLGRLTTLRMAGNNLTDLGVKALASAAHLGRLTHLDLHLNRIGAEGARALAGSPCLTRLTSLQLQQCGIADAGLTALAGAPSLRELRVVDLDTNNIGDDGAEALAASPHLARLTTIDLRGNRIGSRGARALADSPYLEQIERLELYRNRFADGDVVRLRERFARKVWL